MWLAARAHSHTLPVAIAILLVLALVGLLPLDPGFRYVVVLSMSVGIAAVGLDLFSGYLGQANFGQFAFVGIGAYAITALRAEAHLDVVLALLATIVLAAVLSAIIGAAMVQLRHFGAALTTFFFAFVLYNMLVVGGIGSLAGPLIGALIFTALPQLMQSTGAAEALLFAVIFLVFVIVLPNGLFGLVEWAWERTLRTPYGPRLAARARALTRWGRTAEEPEQAPATPPAAPATDGELALVAEEVTVIFGGVRALDGVSFRVQAGTIHALVGPNGAGKTTFLNGVSGLLRLSGGRIVVRGRDVGGSQAHQIRALGVARTFQNPALVPDLTVLDNVMLGLYASQRWSLARDLAGGWASRNRQQAVRGLAAAALRQVDLPPQRWEVLAGDLSLGEQKVVDVARAIAGGSRLLLLDEPTSGLGDQEIQKVAELLTRLRGEHGLSILVVAHNVGFVQQVSDAVTVLDFGKVIAQGEPERVISDPEVITAYLGIAETGAGV